MASTKFYTLSLHDALPIFGRHEGRLRKPGSDTRRCRSPPAGARSWTAVGARACPGAVPRPRTCRAGDSRTRSEEHTSELQSHVNLVCRLLLEKKKKTPKLD